MEKIPVFMNSEHFDVTSTKSLHCLKKLTSGHNPDHSWVTPTADLQWNGETRIPRKSKIHSSTKFDEYKNKFGKVLSTGSEPMTDTNVSIFPTLKLISQITPS